MSLIVAIVARDRARTWFFGAVSRVGFGDAHSDIFALERSFAPRPE